MNIQVRVTIEEIARMADVSKATVSRVLNEREGVGEVTRKRVWRVIEETGYNPSLLAKGIVTSKTKILGMVVPDITNPFFSELIRYVEHYAGLGDYSVFVCCTDGRPEREEQYLRTLIVKRVDGVILVGSSDQPGNMHGRLKKYGIPCVLLDRRMSFEHSACIAVNNEYALYYMTEYLIHHGNKRIAFLSGGRGLSSSAERKEGYIQALKQYRIPIDERLILMGDYTMESGYMLAKQLYEKQIGFTAILAGSDIMAVGVLKALREEKRNVPEDVEVIGFDNIEICTAINPALSTVEQPVSEMGEYGVKILLNLIEGKEPPKRRLRLKPRFVFRETTKGGKKE